VKKINEHRITNRLLEMMMSERRPRGRPHTQWIDKLREMWSGEESSSLAEGI
jgi:hypothetical protein